MSSISLARSYAQSIFQAAKESNKTDMVYKELKVLDEAFKDETISEFFENPTLKAEHKKEAVTALVKQFNFSEEMKSFLMIVADKGRTSVLPKIVDSYQNYIDEDNGVTRGEVVSSHQLSPAEREQITDIVSKKTNKRVILTYKEDSKLIGGLIARVDGFTFDDTLSMHLNRLNEDLKRRVH